MKKGYRNNGTISNGKAWKAAFEVVIAVVTDVLFTCFCYRIGVIEPSQMVTLDESH